MFSIIRTALFLQDAWLTISSFQPGWFPYVLTFVRMEHPGLTYQRMIQWAAKVQAILDCWYAEYGTTRVSDLVRHLPHTARSLVVAAVVANDVPLLKILHGKLDLFTAPRFQLDVASASGSLEALVYLLDLGNLECAKLTMDLAAHFGHLNVVKFLHINRTEGCSSEAMGLAADHGHMEVLQ
ncbi:hypothetical protein LEN26_016921 [Aphanomyces euteiches]|nr:hypothetical protein LEN26_016921 [Aphanomyces euteiches]KAH9113723.1 hypothetical protein AeMF1_012125 [Aphanomyces euteiches]KAH9188297.1 hypothetical protein AeNC1_009729 [Aphanomyces euteiches]